MHLLHLNPLPPAGEYAWGLQLLAEGLAKGRITVKLHLRLDRLIESWLPRRVTGKQERAVQIELVSHRQAIHLWNPAALDQWIGPAQRFQTCPGLVLTVNQRQPGHRPSTLSKEKIEQLILFLCEHSHRLRQR